MFVKLKLIFFILIFSFSSLFSFNLLRNFFENKNIFSYKDKKTKDEEEELLKQKVNDVKIDFFLKWFKPQQLSNENNEKLSKDLKSLLPFFNLNYDENHILEKIYHKKVQEDSSSIKYSFFEIRKILNETDEKFNLFLYEDELIKLLDFSSYLKYLSSIDIIFNDQTLFSNKLIKLNEEIKKDFEIILDYYHEKIPWSFLDYFLEIILILISILNSENSFFNISENKSKFLCKNDFSKKDFSSIEDFYKEIIDCNLNFIIKELYEYISLYDLYLLGRSKILNNDNQESHYPKEININKDFWEQFKIYYQLNITLTDHPYRKIENFFIDYPYGILTFEWRMIYNKDEPLKKIVFNQIIYEEKLKNKEWWEKFKKDHYQLISDNNNYQEIEIKVKNNPEKKLNFKIKNIYIDNILSKLNITLSNSNESIDKISNESSIAIDNPQENLSRTFFEFLSRNIKNIIIYFSFILFNKKIIDFSNINSFIDSLNSIKHFFKLYIFSDFSFSEENNYYSKEDKYNQKLNEIFSIFEENLEAVISYFCDSYLNICYFFPLSLNDEIKMEIIKNLKEQKIEIFKKYFHFFQMIEKNFFIIEELLRIFDSNFIKKFFIYFSKFISFFLKKNYKDLINEVLYKDKNFLSIKDIFNFLESEYVLNDNDFFNFIKKYFFDEKSSFFSVIKDNFFINNKIINEKIKTLKTKLYTYWKFLKQIFNFREIKISYLEKNFNDLIIDFKDENSTKVYRIEASFNKDNDLNDIRMIDNIEN